MREPISNCRTEIEYFYYEDDSKTISMTPNVKITSDGIDAAISVTYGGQELDGVSVNLKVQGAEEENVEMENEET